MTRIQLARDGQYAPSCYIICRQRPDGTYDTRDEANTILIQTDWDYPGVARAFGGAFGDGQIAESETFLLTHIGATAEDPGYFS